MNEIKVGNWVYVSDTSKQHAFDYRTKVKVQDILPDGSIKTSADLVWQYAVRACKTVEEHEYMLANQIPSIENLEAGQELTSYQVLKWIEVHGSTEGLQIYDSYDNEWYCPATDQVTRFYVNNQYRVAPKEVNLPNDPTTWEEGVKVFAREFDSSQAILADFESYAMGRHFQFIVKEIGRAGYLSCRVAKLATPEQVKAWQALQESIEEGTKIF